MPQEDLGYVKLEWTCPNCGNRNPGPQKTCSGCGNPQPENVEFHLPERQEILNDEQEIAAARKGPDIHCAFCGARNPAGSSTCQQCGADLKEGKARTSGQVLGALESGPETQVTCPSCGAVNSDQALRCSKCGSPLKEPVQAKTTVSHRLHPKSSCGWRGPGHPCFCLLAAGLGAYFLFMRPSASQTATVESMSWKTSVAVEALQPVNKQDWKVTSRRAPRLAPAAMSIHIRPSSRRFNPPRCAALPTSRTRARAMGRRCRIASIAFIVKNAVTLCANGRSWTGCRCRETTDTALGVTA